MAQEIAVAMIDHRQTIIDEADRGVAKRRFGPQFCGYAPFAEQTFGDVPPRCVGRVAVGRTDHEGQSFAPLGAESSIGRGHSSSNAPQTFGRC